MVYFLGVELYFTPTFKTIINFNKITKMKRFLTWITGLAILLAGASLLNLPINHYEEIKWWWVVVDVLFGGYLSYRGGSLISDSIK